MYADLSTNSLSSTCNWQRKRPAKAAMIRAMNAWDIIAGGGSIALWFALMGLYVWWEGFGGRARWQRRRGR